MFVSFSRMHSSAGLSAQIEIQSTQVGFMQAKQSGTENAQHVFLFVSKYAKASSGHSILLQLYTNVFISSVRSSNSHPDLLLIHPPTPLFQITTVLNTGLSLSEPLQLYQRQSLDSSAGYMYTLCAR